MVWTVDLLEAIGFDGGSRCSLVVDYLRFEGLERKKIDKNDSFDY